MSIITRLSISIHLIILKYPCLHPIYTTEFEGWYLPKIMEKIYTIRRQLLHQIQRCSSQSSKWETYHYYRKGNLFIN